MCGILASYGFISNKELLHYINKITLRGKDTFGINLIKNKSSENFFYSYENLNLKELRDIAIDNETLAIANARLITNGSNINNTQPLCNDNISLSHNGIIVDFSDLKSNSIELDQNVKSDTQILFDQIKKISEGDQVKTNIEKFLNSLNGEINLIFYLKKESKLYYYTNCGSLFIKIKNEKILILSEKNFFLKKDQPNVKQIDKNILFEINLKNNLKINQQRNLKNVFNNPKNNNNIDNTLFEDVSEKIEKKISTVVRCIKCLIPITYPKIEFNKSGICTFCDNNHLLKEKHFDEEDLKNLLSNKSKKCLVGLSGGFDSCYTLYYVKEILKLDPIAFTYDWGLTTDMARVNQSIMCQKLNVEHIIRTDNMSQKRDYIRTNIEAWFNRPHPGLIPLFMAGDKKFLHFERKLKKELNIDYSFFGTGSGSENRPFYFLFAGASLNGSNDDGDMSKMNLDTKLKLLFFYGINFLRNPQLINKSLFNSGLAYYYSFFEKYNYISLFKFLKIKDDEKNNFLINEFGLKNDEKYGKEIWRMGDGHSSFNNLLYSALCGFTEIDDQLSIAIRNNQLEREKAFSRVLKHNLPKKDMLQYFFDLIKIDANKTLKKVLKLNEFQA
tara:strand:+ start:1368 stop:3209 length:1842 start_codon:yes stop_codon:yes gene_type:complete